MKSQISFQVLITAILLTATVSASVLTGTPITLNDYVGTYKIHFNTELPFNSAMVLDPATNIWYSITVTDTSITVSRNITTPDVYLFPTSHDIEGIYNIISDGKITFTEKIELTWKWYFMQKSWS